MIYAVMVAVVGCLTSSAWAAPKPLVSTVAVVGTQAITDRAWQRQVQRLEDQGAGRHMSSQDLKQLALESLINRAVQLEAAEQAGIDVPPSLLHQALAASAKERGLALKAWQAREGRAWAGVRRRVRNELLLMRFQQISLAPSIRISSSDVDQALAERQAGTRVKLDDWWYQGPSKARQADVHALVLQLKRLKGQGERVAPHLKKAFEWRQMGWQRLDQLPDVFVKVLQATPQSTVLSPFKAANGWHVLVRRAKEALPHLSRAEVRHMLFAKALQAKLPEWVAALRAKAYVKRFV